MRRYYASPEIEIRVYRVSHSVFTDSENIHDGDEFDLDAAGQPQDDLFAD